MMHVILFLEAGFVRLQFCMSTGLRVFIFWLQDIMREQVMSHVAALRKDMVILEKSELSDLRNENDKLKLLLKQTQSQV